MVWEQYDVSGDRPEQPDEPPATVGPTQPRRPRDPGFSGSPSTGTTAGSPTVAGGSRGSAGLIVGLVAVIGTIGGGVAIASSAAEPEPDYSGFYSCVAEEEADDPGLLSPADLCEIGNERPPDYVDNYEYDPFDATGGY